MSKKITCHLCEKKRPRLPDWNGETICPYCLSRFTAMMSQAATTRNERLADFMDLFGKADG